jgi:ADP-ribosylglycohydrolase
MVVGAFIGDSHALGAHWVYNTRAIDKKIGRVTELIDPIVKTFHPNKKAGDLTHYGDQMLLFFEHVGSAGEFNRDAYLKAWTEFFDSYGGYKDHAMKDTRENIRGGVAVPGSGSTDLAGIFYVPVLLYFSGSDEEQLAAGIDSAVTMTHNSPSVIQAARFFSALLREVLHGAGPIEAIDRLLGSGSYDADFSGLVKKGVDSIGAGSRETIKEFGQACPADHGVPGVIHLIGTYEDDFETALVENVMAGGDSAARGIAVGAVLGAHNGLSVIPQRWRGALSPRTKIEALL